ncbi:hypothetical protein H0W32_03425 [Patescibacteria group bacterium]|nr:hypothetical protein [Patescibacteria group bacterium]
MKNNTFIETSVSVLLVVLVLLIWNPLHFWMTDMILISMLISILMVFAIFATFILRENVRDEREGMHRLLAGRMAFLLGSITLVIGILVQAYSHAVDIWLVLTLVVMVLAKMGTRLYSDKRL